LKFYKGYGLVFVSDIELPEFQITSKNSADVSISFSKIEDALPEPYTGKNRSWHASMDKWTLCVKGIGCFKVINGDTILVDPYDTAKPDDLRFVLLGSVLAALLQQRKLLVLHAGAIRTKRGAVLFIGPSGNGKSTLTAALSRLGYGIISDDVVAVDTSGDNFLVLPAFPRLRLWADAVSALKLDGKDLEKARAGLNKFLVPVADFADENTPLYKIYILSVHNGTSVTLSGVSSVEKVGALIDNTYRIKFLSGFGLAEHHHVQITSIAKYVEMLKIERPLEPFMINRLARSIEENLNL